MDKIIGVTEFQRRFKAVFDEVAKNRIAYILTRGSRPEAVMVPYEQYQKFVRMNESEVMSRFDILARRMEEMNARYSDEEVDRDLREASRELRSRKRRV